MNMKYSIELPCKIGDTVYWVTGGYIEEHKVLCFMYDMLGLHFVFKGFPPVIDKFLGNRLFLTREEAEARLKELKGEDNFEKALPWFSITYEKGEIKDCTMVARWLIEKFPFYYDKELTVIRGRYYQTIQAETAEKAKKIFFDNLTRYKAEKMGLT